MKKIIPTFFLMLSYCLAFGTDFTLKSKITNGNDDIEVYSTYKNFTSADLELGGYDNGRVYVAVRFANLNLPTNANIKKAYIQFTTYNEKSRTATISIKCQNGNAGAYSSSENLLNRTYVSNSITWNAPEWKDSGERGSNQRTPELKTLIQSAIASGWQSGNALSFILQGNASEVDVVNAASYESTSTHETAPELVIEYSIDDTPANTLKSYTISNGNDDVEVYPLYKNFTSTDLELGGFDAARVYVALRFTNINIPSSSVIKKAYIQFSTKNPKSKKATIVIKAQKGNAASYGASENLQSRAYVSNTVSWSPPEWKIANERGINQRTPDLTSLINAAIASGWQSGNALSFIIQGNGSEVDINNACSYETRSDRSGAPTLVIEYADQCISDVTKPTFNNCPSNINLSTTGSSAVATWTAPTVSDNCTANITPSVASFPTTGLSSGSAFPVGTTTITYTAKDAKGNTATCSFTVTVAKIDPCATDVTKPIFSNCPSNINLSTTGSSAVATWTAPTVSDNCTANINPSVASSPTTGLISGSAFPIGTTTITYSATDAKGNTATCSFTITVTKTDPCATDVTKPNINNCPSNINLSTTGSSAVATWTTPTVSDNCTANITPSVASSPTTGLNSGSAFPIGTTTISYTAKDAKGNTATCSFTVTVAKIDPCASDNTNPIFNNCPSNINLSTTGNSVTATWNVPTVSDNCTSNITPSVSSSPTTGLNSGSAFPVGTTTITYTARDAKGNTATCSFTVTVAKIDPCATDVTNPNFNNCPSNINLSTTGTSATASWTAPTVSDNCTANITPSVSSSPTTGLNSGSAFPIGTTTITYTATDAKGNTATCSFTVTVTKALPSPITGLFINEATGTAGQGRPLDFVEIYNNNSGDVTLTDVFISDERSLPLKYAFPSGSSIAAKGFRKIDANGDLIVSNDSTGAFGISGTGETIYLNQRLNGSIVVLDSLVVGATSFNSSFGRFPDGSSNVIQFARGTPNASNNNAKQLLQVGFSQPRGIYTTPFNLSITAPAGSTVRYTTDKTKPTATTGTIYTTPILIDKSTLLRVFVFTNTGESRVITQTYIFPNSVSQQLALGTPEVETALKELPTVSISTVDSINSTSAVPCTFEYINKFGDPSSAFVDAGIRYFGNSSLVNPKKSLRISFRASFGYNKFKHKVFERLPLETYNPTDEFDNLEIRAGNEARYYTNTSDYVAHGLLRRLGSKNIHVRFVNVFIDGEYWGVAPLREKFDSKYAAPYYGKTDADYDYLQTQDVVNDWPVDSDVFTDPGDGTLDQFQQVLSANQNRDFQALKQRVDIKHFINFMMTFLIGNQEPEYKAVIGKNFATPMVFWLQDVDAYFIDDAVIPGYQYHLANNIKGPHNLLAMTGVGGETPVLEYKTVFRDQVELSFIRPNGVLTSDSVLSFVNSALNIVRNSVPLEFARWNEVTQGTWDFRAESIVSTMPERISTVINALRAQNLVHTLQPVTFSKASGNTVAAGERIFITNPNANTVVYYTTDGTDVVLDNEISPSAKLYNAATGLILPAGTVKVRARAFATGNFGMYNDATYNVTVATGRQTALSFDAYGRQSGQEVVLDWASNANKLAVYYVVEKLNMQKQDFEIIERVDAKFSNALYALHQYTVNDRNPNIGENVYRIGLILDNQNYLEYTPSFTVEYRPFKQGRVFPNPAADNFTVDLSLVEKLPVTVQLVNMMGQVIEQKRFDNAPKVVNFDTNALKGGHYFLHIKAQGKRDYIEKVVVLGY